MPVYVVAQGRIENREMLDQYIAKALPTIQSAGGRVLAFDETPEIVEGQIEHPRTVILEFESQDAFRAWYDSPNAVSPSMRRRKGASGARSPPPPDTGRGEVLAQRVSATRKNRAALHERHRFSGLGLL